MTAWKPEPLAEAESPVTCRDDGSIDTGFYLARARRLRNASLAASLRGGALRCIAWFGRRLRFGQPERAEL